VSLLFPEHHLLKGFKEVDHIIDVGPGIRPVNFFPVKTHLCIEPYWRYAEILGAHGYDVINSEAYDALPEVESVDSIFLLDVIEHMEKPIGQHVLKLCKKNAKSQVIVFTPKGFEEQTGDRWNLGGDYWQTHRSGWDADDFYGWTITQDKKSILAIHDIKS